MCYHNTLIASKQQLEVRYKATLETQATFNPVYHENAFNHPLHPIVTQEAPSQLQLYAWGLIPAWVKSRDEALKMRTYTPNAKSETIFEKPSFRTAINKQRCLIPSTGFFEWREHNKKKYPYYIKLKTGAIFSMAGIYDQWVDKATGELYHTYSIITTEANPLMATIHNVKKRMPLILEQADETHWLNAALQHPDIQALMKPFSDEGMEAYTISKLITSRSQDANVPEVIHPYFY